MARLTKEIWEKIRVEYENTNDSYNVLAKRYGVDVAAVSRTAKKNNWIKGRHAEIIETKVKAVQTLQDVDKQTQEMPLLDQWGIDKAVSEQLTMVGNLTKLSNVLAIKGIELAAQCKTPEAWLTLTQGRKNLSPSVPAKEVTANVNVQAQAASLTPSPNPIENYRRALRGDFAED